MQRLNYNKLIIILKAGDVELKVFFVTPDDDSEIDGNSLSDGNYPFLEEHDVVFNKSSTLFEPQPSSKTKTKSSISSDAQSIVSVNSGSNNLNKQRTTADDESIKKSSLLNQLDKISKVVDNSTSTTTTTNSVKS